MKELLINKNFNDQKQFTFIFVLFSLLSKKGDFYVVPNRIQYIVEVIYSVIYGLLNDNVGPVAKSFFPCILLYLF